MNESGAVGRGSEWERGYNDRVREYETYEKEGKHECLSSVQGLLNYSHLKTFFLYRISYDMDKDTDRTASGLVPIDVPPATQRTRRRTLEPWCRPRRSWAVRQMASRVQRSLRIVRTQKERLGYSLVPVVAQTRM